MADQELPPPSQVVPLDFDSVETIPESHSWPDSNGLLSTDEKVTIPSIDLVDDNAPELIGRACEEWGMFQLVNHGVPKTLIAKAEKEARRLFGLPTRQKMMALYSPDSVTGYGMAVISKYYQKYMWHEGFTIMGSPVDDAKKLWQSEYKQFCDVMEEYQTKMRDLADKIIRLVFKFLDISEQVVEKLLPSTNDVGQLYTALRLNSYPPCPDPSQVMGLAAHTDTSLFTILHGQAGIDGLQVFKDKVGWIPLSPMSGTLIVNVGDLLHILSNGRFQSILHRVMIQGKEHRLSLAYFYYPPNELYISPHCNPLSESPQTPLYRCVKVRDYFSMKAKNKGKGLSTIKI